jgi:triosephosphate isomerase
VGETKSERDAGRAREVLDRQVRVALRDVDPATAASLVFAYEPLWAVGSSEPASTAIVQEVHQQIRALIAGVLGPNIAEQTRIIYGGSVDPNNAASLCDLDDVDGALVGREGLDAESFVEIARSGAQVSSSWEIPGSASAYLETAEPLATRRIDKR